MFSTVPISSQWTHTGDYRINFPVWLITFGSIAMVIDFGTLFREKCTIPSYLSSFADLIVSNAMSSHFCH